MHEPSFDYIPACVSITMADFTTVPSSLAVAVGEEAVFQCNYPGALYIDWAINEVFIHIGVFSFIPSNAALSVSEQHFDTLTITALPEYNGTEVQCVAWLLASVQLTSPVLLLINFNSKPKKNSLIVQKIYNNIIIIIILLLYFFIVRKCLLY